MLMTDDTDLKRNWKLLFSKPLFQAGLFNIRKDRIFNVQKEVEFDITVMESADAVNVIPITKNQEIIFVRQYRFGTQQITLELPGGLMEPNEVPIQTAKRELQEETGYSGGQLSYLGKTASHPVFMNSYIHHVLALDIEPIGSTNFDDAELAEVVLIPKSEVKTMMKKGAFDHPHAVAALVRYL